MQVQDTLRRAEKGRANCWQSRTDRVRNTRLAVDARRQARKLAEEARQSGAVSTKSSRGWGFSKHKNSSQASSSSPAAIPPRNPNTYMSQVPPCTPTIESSHEDPNVVPENLSSRTSLNQTISAGAQGSAGKCQQEDRSAQASQGQRTRVSARSPPSPPLSSSQKPVLELWSR